MTTEQICEPLSVAELHDFGLKLQELWRRLSAKEQTYFARLIAPAEDPQDGEVQGYGGYVEYGQTALGMIWTLIQNNPNPFTPQPVSSTPVSAASSGTTGGSYGGVTGTRQMN